ncbi:MAG: TonB-dependent receptor [Helicobacteraceae bacterium]|jgi:TonB-dependent receptor|nr:TonB-dependent receptor [Helicobacteraceae bacterium]
MKTLLLLLSFTISLFAIETGELSFYLIKDGKPLSNQQVIIFEKVTQQTADIKGFATRQTAFTTDNDGYVYTVLPVGSFQLQVVAIEEGTPKAFVKKNFVIKEGKESQIIVALKEDNTIAFEDDEAPKVAAEDLNTTKLIAKEPGSVMLSLVSSEDQKPVANARIFVKGQKVDVKTDAKGFLDLTLPEGEQTISVIHSDFSSQTFKVMVVAKESVSKSVELSPSSMELEEFVVLAPHVEGSVASVIAEERNSDAVGNVLGSEQFSKSGDSSVASALKRVSGITIVGGKYVYVRGLGDRYSTVMLNNLHVPSPEPTKRVVPLDIFPTSIVESITIQKSYTGDLPASFGGGTVLIKSKDIPENDEGYAALGLELLVNSATGKEGTTNSDNAVPLPGSALIGGNNVGGRSVTSDVLNSRTLNYETTNLSPGMKVEVSAGKSFSITDDVSIGASGTVYYKNSSENDKTQYDKYFYDINSNSVNHESQTEADITSFNTELAGMVNVGMNYFEHNKIKYTFFTSQHTSDKTTLSSIDYTGATEDREKTYYEYVEKSLMSNQLSGENELRFSNSTDGYFDNLKIDWALENSVANRDEPGTVEYNYLHQTSGLNWDRKNWYYYFILEDTVNNYRADLTLPFEFNDNENYTQAGVFIYNKSRNFDSRRFKMLSNNFDLTQDDMDTIYDTYANDLEFSASYRDTDSYQATQDVTAFYLKQLISVTHDLDVVASVRQESSTQQLTDAAAVYAPLETSDLFPSLGLTYRFDNDDMQIRASYASTISRPDFREFSNSRYKDPITENIVFGNPDLKATYINHYDLKYEWYMQADELFSLALFAKEFTNPIEKVIKLDDSQDNIFQETYQNADSATSYGIEVDYRKRFGFISSSLDNLLFATNVALIQSNITLNSDPDNAFTSRLTSKKRAMQGQSPYVVNFTLGYDNADSGDSALFLFNQIGPRIVSLGTDKNEDIYEQPFSKLDFVTQWKLNNYYLQDSDLTYSLKFKAENLLDSKVEFTQGDLTTAVTKPGRYFSLAIKIAY